MKPFTDPFPFRKPENRSSIGEVIARITNGEPVVESHTRAQLEKLSITRLRELKKKYEAAVLKGDRDAARELATIRGLLRAKGAGSVVDEGVVNGQPRPVEDPITEDAMTAERDAELRGKMKREKDYGEYRKLRAQREKEAKSKKLFGKGGKIDTSRKPDVSKSKQIWEAVTPAQRKVFNAERERMMTALNNPNKKLSPTEREAVLARGARNAAAEVRKGAVSPTGEKSPVHAQAKAHHEYARKESKKMDAIAKRKGVQESQELDEGVANITAAVLLLPPAVKQALLAAVVGGYAVSYALDELRGLELRTRTAALKVGAWLKRKANQEGVDAAKAALQAKTPAKAKRKGVQESQELDERLVGGADFLQASKNLLTGKGFKTNREVSGARVNANMAAMQRRKARAAKKKG